MIRALFFSLLLTLIVLPSNAQADSYFEWSRVTGLPNFLWKSLAANHDGSKLIAYASANTGDSSYPNYLYRSIDSGTTWSPLSAGGARVWSQVVTDATGETIVASVNRGHLYISGDGGVNWREELAGLSLATGALALSLDGRKIALGRTNNSLYTSADGGVTWVTQTNPGGGNWNSLNFSSDGLRLFATTGERGLFRSTNFGNTWSLTVIDPSQSFTNLYVNGDGTVLSTVTGDGGYYYSTNSGAAWRRIELGQTFAFPKLAGALNGQRLVVNALNVSTLPFSNDLGLTWINVDTPYSVLFNSLSYFTPDGRTLFIQFTNQGLWRGSYSPPPPPPRPRVEVALDPPQLSSIIPPLDTTTLSESSTSVTLHGRFVEPIKAIDIDGHSLASSSWHQGTEALVLDLGALSTGTHQIDIFNGSIPILAVPMNIQWRGVSNNLSLKPRARITYIRCQKLPNSPRSAARIRVVYGVDPQCPYGSIAIK